MTTLRELMGRVQSGEATVADAVTAIRAEAVPIVVRSTANTMGEAYRDAEDMPGDSDTFWIDAAYHAGVITDADYERIFDAVDHPHNTRRNTKP